MFTKPMTFNIAFVSSTLTPYVLRNRMSSVSSVSKLLGTCILFVICPYPMNRESNFE